MHWADVVAKELSARGDAHRIATGITPSGNIHLGNMREILTGDIIARAVRSRGMQGELLYMADTFDPLRKVYPFLDSSYEVHVGKPLSEIPCPCGSHENYAEHFLEPFLAALDSLGIEHKTHRVHELYREGHYSETAKKAMDNRTVIKDILSGLSGRDMVENWWPYTIKCGSCGKFGAEITFYSWPKAHYHCKCDFEGSADLRIDDGKLLWRVDWPARWSHLGITCEPFGKDHATKGGSYDTGSKIAEEVFGTKPPFPVVYEWIQLKGKGAMSSSAGVVVSAQDMLSMTPPEVMRFLIAKNNPGKHIDFDPGLGILALVDEYDRLEQKVLGGEFVDDEKRMYEMSQPGEMLSSLPLFVPYRHFVSLVQIANDWEGIKEIILRTMDMEGTSEEDEKHLKQRALSTIFWIENFAPEDVKFSVLKDAPEIDLNLEEKDAMQVLISVLSNVTWDAEGIHNAFYGAAEESGLKANILFRAVYRAIIGQNRGPRMGFFLSTLEKKWVMERLNNYLGGG